ncbi:reverse transcriptase domain-containing protein [Tanacetum coccineum]|uniref:Reverse transcriptase domain-containing protein n=1 Tax=Tanacetum coccineum TaxID=301880 RepID=A0ABQ4X5J3_9ASTR
MYMTTLKRYVSHAEQANFNQANSGYRPSRWYQTKFDLPGFHPCSDFLMPKLVKTISIEEITSIKTEEKNFNQGLFIDLRVSSNPVVNQPVAHQGPAPRTREATKTSKPPVVQIQSLIQILRPNVNPVVTPAILKHNSISITKEMFERRKEKAIRSNEISMKSLEIKTPLNENCSAVILNKLPKKLGDPGRFLIPCEFTGITTCNALADLGASINLMPYSVWKSLSLSELTPTCMTLELADRSITEPIEPRSSLNSSGDCFLKTSQALMFLWRRRITLRVGKEAITFNLDQTSKYSADYTPYACQQKYGVSIWLVIDYYQEVLGFSNVIRDLYSGNPTPFFEPIVSNASPTLLLSGTIPVGDILKNSQTLAELKPENPSINEPPEVELKELPYPFLNSHLEGDRQSCLYAVITTEDIELIPTRHWVTRDANPNLAQKIKEMTKPSHAIRNFYLIVRMPFGKALFSGHKISTSGLEVDSAKSPRLENPHQDKLENKEINEGISSRDSMVPIALSRSKYPIGTDNQEKDEKQSQNDKTGLGMEKL